MLQRDEPLDLVIGTGEGHTVREFCELAFAHVGLEWEPYVALDPRYLRPTDVDVLVADPTRARTELGWIPSVSFEELVTTMVEADLANIGVGLEEARQRVASGKVRAPV
jgi:GDPmannose 4,6-dehydratase